MLQRFKLLNFRLFIASVMSIILLTGCINRVSDLIAPHKLPLSEVSPQLRFEQEVMIVRLTQVLQQAELSKSEKADLLFERGVIYDSLGLWSLARNDFSEAVELNPKMAAAYNYLGLYLLLEDDYDSSVDAFNAVLELDPNYDYTRLNRGLSFYYSGRYAEAERDLLYFYEADKTDPYRVLWLYFNELELSPSEAKANLATRSKGLANTFWGTNIVSYFLGDYTLEQLRLKMNAQAEPNTAQYAEILTETYFYLAKQTLKLNQVEEASSLFRLTIANQVYNFVEYRFALFELARLRANKTAPVTIGKVVVGIN
ncbi:lipoprotein NlpI [Ursidibacter maritimus]|uniref:Lipoprotein NlpI n=1 Tax=Ursidibacter maritimus TaxID=1331689 RepID=A0A949SYT8_9PAST|nr:lipoprotein NlpI [Ursidibacter maritimus]KAE9540323.1 lipoprotein NlpI-like protein [Ursidibacter maritimus]MBV6524486.1 lipoprotein NlpI [Ursidibacter maritimus]MBV6525314.1 lipoprotein NlpI [Ursidibacter maritimus]MBV6528017.1 lipoprotein NlpI [Ursidibacter maritimus]MBV6529125.1 lipoprotein NlpI [Ursidibacter maritimus]